MQSEIKNDITEIDIPSYIRYMGAGKEGCHHHCIPNHCTPIEKERADYSSIVIILFIGGLFFWMGYFLCLVRG